VVRGAPHREKRDDSNSYRESGGVIAEAEEEFENNGEPWTNRNYYWVVACKNIRFHRLTNIYYTHHIPLGETDAVSPRLPIDEPFNVRCDVCGEGYVYHVSEVLRSETEVLSPFTPHPLFRV
jgi:hypothetical protein